MRSIIKGDGYDPAFLLSSAFVWLISASILLIISAVILCEIGCTEQSLGYVSSFISFGSALAAGAAAARRRKKKNLYTALLTAAALVIALLTVGFLIDGIEIEASAIMSVVSFTFAGCVVGVISFSSGVKRKQYRPNI